MSSAALLGSKTFRTATQSTVEVRGEGQDPEDGGHRTLLQLNEPRTTG